MCRIACRKVLDKLTTGYLLSRHSYCLRIQIILPPLSVLLKPLLSPSCCGKLRALGENFVRRHYPIGLAEMTPVFCLSCCSLHYCSPVTLSPIICLYLFCRPVLPVAAIVAATFCPQPSNDRAPPSGIYKKIPPFHWKRWDMCH